MVMTMFRFDDMLDSIRIASFDKTSLNSYSPILYHVVRDLIIQWAAFQVPGRGDIRC